MALRNISAVCRGEMALSGEINLLPPRLQVEGTHEREGERQKMKIAALIIKARLDLELLLLRVQSPSYFRTHVKSPHCSTR